MRLSDELGTIVGYAREEAMRTGSILIGPDHLMLGILRHCSNSVAGAMRRMGVDVGELKDFIDASLFGSCSIPYDRIDEVRLSREGQSALGLAALEAQTEGLEETCTRHLAGAILRMPESRSKSYLEENGFSRDDLLALLKPAAAQPRRVRGFTITVHPGKIYS